MSGVLDNNTQPFQADDVRKTFKNSTHLVIDNAGHESILVDPQVQQTMGKHLLHTRMHDEWFIVFDQELIKLNAEVRMKSRNPINVRRNFHYLTFHDAPADS
ncbi:MAG: hypothetical protein ACREBC_33935 [Pyrinomonadaceae bacterium]